MATKIKPFNLHTSVDSHVKGLIDSDYVQARQTAGTDSSSTQAMIDSNFANMDVDIHMPDNQKITFGNDSDGSIRHSGSNFQLLNTSGGIQVTNYANDLDVDIRTDDGSGGVTEYFRLDGGTTSMVASKNIGFLDGLRATFGSGADMAIYHNGTTTNIENVNGKLRLIQTEDDGDISFESDDGSGGITEYFRLDGGLATGGTVYTVFPDNSRATFGAGYDLQIYHDATNSYIKQGAGGNLIIQQETDDGDIIFKSDDGSGGLATYFKLDGSGTTTVFHKDIRFDDSVLAKFGADSDLEIMHKYKTGALFEAAVAMGYLAMNVGHEDNRAKSMRSFMSRLGVGFQVVDDILDTVGLQKTTGKEAGRDKILNKPNFVDLLGVEQAKEYAGECLNSALTALEKFGGEADFLRYIANRLVKRSF